MDPRRVRLGLALVALPGLALGISRAVSDYRKTGAYTAGALAADIITLLAAIAVVFVAYRIATKPRPPGDDDA